MNYYETMTHVMTELGQREDTVFIGQSVGYPGTGMTDTLKNVPREKILELPVMEESQLGMAIGMALDGRLPICIYPRWNFLLLATNQLVNHLDKIPIYSGGGFKPRVIIRVAVPTPEPLDPGPQHLGNFSDAFCRMLETVHVVELRSAAYIESEYQIATLENNGSSIMVEFAEMYYK